MRRGFDSLSGLVITGLGMNVLCGAVFIFINKKRNQVKLLLWEGDGLAMYYKRRQAICIPPANYILLKLLHQNRFAYKNYHGKRS